MNTIDAWLTHMFAPYPSTPRLAEARDELRQMMEDKYDSLVERGESPAAALGTVIAEFGELHELAPVLGITDDLNTALEPVREADALALANAREANRFLLSGPVALFVVALAPLFLLSDGDGSQGMNAATGSVIALVLVAIGVGLLMVRSMRLNPLRERLDGQFVMPDLRRSLEAQYDERRPTYQRTVIAAVVLFIVSAIPLFLSVYFMWDSRPVGLVMTMCVVAVGLLLILTSYEYTHASLDPLDVASDEDGDEDGGPVGAIASVYWPLVTTIFFIWSFGFDAWGRSWIVWPVAAAAFAAIAAAVELRHKDRENSGK